MANWSNPVLTSTYTNVLNELKARDEDAAKFFDGVTISNIPTGTKRWNAGNYRFESWNGTAWEEMSARYTFPRITATNGLITCNVDTSNQSAHLSIGDSRTGSGFTSISLIGDTTYLPGGYSFRILRQNTGANANTDIFHRGTGRMRYRAEDAGSQSWSTNGVERLVLDNAGNFYINTPAGIRHPGDGNTDIGVSVNGLGTLFGSRDSAAAVQLNRNGTDGEIIAFRKNGVFLAGNTISVSGSVINYNTTSDYRLKDLHGPVSNALNRVKQVPVHSFSYKQSNQVRDGWLAHQLQEVAPYAVTGERDGEEYQGVDAGKVVPLLWAAVQELSEQVSELSKQLAELRETCSATANE